MTVGIEAFEDVQRVLSLRCSSMVLSFFLKFSGRDFPLNGLIIVDFSKLSVQLQFNFFIMRSQRG